MLSGTWKLPFIACVARDSSLASLSSYYSQACKRKVNNMPPSAPLGLAITHVEGLAVVGKHLVVVGKQQHSVSILFPLPLCHGAGPLGLNGTGEWHGLTQVNRVSSRSSSQPPVLPSPLVYLNVIFNLSSTPWSLTHHRLTSFLPCPFILSSINSGPYHPPQEASHNPDKLKALRPQTHLTKPSSFPE